MELYEWQRIDPMNGLVQPWLTHPALDEIATWDMSDKIIWEWGAGMGDVWLATRCKELNVVERKMEWYIQCGVNSRLQNSPMYYHYRPCDDSSGMQDFYCSIPTDLKPDIFIIDDAYRYECLVKALEYRPCTIICDNWQQDYVFISPAAEELMAQYEGKFYLQPGHTNHEGRPWQTAIWHIK